MAFATRIKLQPIGNRAKYRELNNTRVGVVFTHDLKLFNVPWAYQDPVHAGKRNNNNYLDRQPLYHSD